MSNSFAPDVPSTTRRRRAAAVPVGLAVIALVTAACGSTAASSVSAPQPARVSSAAASATGSAPATTAVLSTASSPLGTILVDAQGRTVYEFASDSKNTSTCSGQCLTYWPPVVAPATVPSAVPGITGALGSFTRKDGGSELTINGLPLYTFAGDTAPGMTAGQGSNGSGAKWWVVAPDGSPITTMAGGTPTGSAPSTSASTKPAAAPAPTGY